MRFLGKFGKFVCWRPPWRVDATSYGESWIRPWEGRAHEYQIWSYFRQIRDTASTDNVLQGAWRRRRLLGQLYFDSLYFS